MSHWVEVSTMTFLLTAGAVVLLVLAVAYGYWRGRNRTGEPVAGRDADGTPRG